MDNYKSKYLEMKLKYINVKQKAGMAKKSSQPMIHDLVRASSYPQNSFKPMIPNDFVRASTYSQNSSARGPVAWQPRMQPMIRSKLTRGYDGMSRARERIFNSNNWINPLTKNKETINYKEIKQLKEPGDAEKNVSLKKAINILINKYKITTDINLAIYLLNKYTYDIELIEEALYNITKYEDVFSEQVQNSGYGLNDKTINYTLSCHAKKLKRIIKIPDNIRVIFYNAPGTNSKCHDGLDICCTTAKNCDKWMDHNYWISGKDKVSDNQGGFYEGPFINDYKLWKHPYAYGDIYSCKNKKVEIKLDYNNSHFIKGINLSNILSQLSIINNERDSEKIILLHIFAFRT